MQSRRSLHTPKVKSANRNAPPLFKFPPSHFVPPYSPANMQKWGPIIRGHNNLRVLIDRVESWPRVGQPAFQSSSQRNFHPKALPKPYVNRSVHTVLNDHNIPSTEDPVCKHIGSSFFYSFQPELRYSSVSGKVFISLSRSIVQSERTSRNSMPHTKRLLLSTTLPNFSWTSWAHWSSFRSVKRLLQRSSLSFLRKMGATNDSCEKKWLAAWADNHAVQLSDGDTAKARTEAWDRANLTQSSLWESSSLFRRAVL